MLRLQILDTKTGVVLWTMMSSALMLTGRNLNDQLVASTTELINSLKALAPPPTQGTAQ